MARLLADRCFFGRAPSLSFGATGKGKMKNAVLGENSRRVLTQRCAGSN
jgi:hypothetical protein